MPYPFLDPTVSPNPAIGGTAVTASDSTVLSPTARALWIGGAGNVAVQLLDNTTVTLVGVAAGSLLPVSARKVMSTNTTATSIVALY